jgi:formate hydrogenlyase subunit 3/multisubunit Na+/H+ antiporter MnhD subunit
MFILVPVGVIILAAVIYLAVSPKSNFRIRIAALIALAVMLISVIVSLILIFGIGPARPEGPFLPFAEAVEQPPESKGNLLALTGFILFLVALFMLVFFMSLREQRKNGKNQ